MPLPRAGLTTRKTVIENLQRAAAGSVTGSQCVPDMRNAVRNGVLEFHSVGESGGNRRGQRASRAMRLAGDARMPKSPAGIAVEQQIFQLRSAHDRGLQGTDAGDAARVLRGHRGDRTQAVRAECGEGGEIRLDTRAATGIGARDHQYLRWALGMLVVCHVVFSQRTGRSTGTEISTARTRI